MGIADPAHYLHSFYFLRALGSLRNFDPAQILDAGCGAGDYSFYLARRYPKVQVLGLDLNEANVQHCREVAQKLGISNVQFEVADLAATDLPSEFDLVIAIDVLEHIAEQRQALRRLSAALRPNGVAFFHLPTGRTRPVPFSRWLGGFHAWAAKEHVAEACTAKEFFESVSVAGLQILQASPTFGYFTGELATSLFNLPYANTRRNQILQGLLAPLCRVLALADNLNLEETRYAAQVLAIKPGA